MKRIKLNPIVEADRNELTFNQILYEKNPNTNKFILYAINQNGLVTPITPSIVAANDAKDVVDMITDNEFKQAFDYFANSASPIKTSAFGKKLYAWKNITGTTITYIYTDTTTIVTTEGSATKTYDNAYNDRSKDVTATSGTGSEQTITSNSIVYTRDTTSDMNVGNCETLFNILKSYLPIKTDTKTSPNVVNTYGYVSADGKTIRIASTDIYQKIINDTANNQYTVSVSELQ